MRYSAWSVGEGFTFIPGDDRPPGEPGAEFLAVFEAGSWEDAMRQYHQWQGWEPYEPLEPVAGNLPSDS